MISSDDFRMGFLFSGEITEKLLAICDLVDEHPYTLLAEAINTTYDAKCGANNEG